MMDYGTQQLFSGLRTGNIASSSLGTALVLLSWMRSHRAPSEERIYARTLHEGQAVEIRLVRGDTVVDATEVVG